MRLKTENYILIRFYFTVATFFPFLFFFLGAQYLHPPLASRLRRLAPWLALQGTMHSNAGVSTDCHLEGHIKRTDHSASCLGSRFPIGAEAIDISWPRMHQGSGLFPRDSLFLFLFRSIAHYYPDLIRCPVEYRTAPHR